MRKRTVRGGRTWRSSLRRSAFSARAEEGGGGPFCSVVWELRTDIFSGSRDASCGSALGSIVDLPYG